MKKGNAGAAAEEKSERKPYRVRIPGFVSDEDIGLGSVIKRATASIGIKACGGCRRRAVTLNHWLIFSGWRSR